MFHDLCTLRSGTKYTWTTFYCKKSVIVSPFCTLDTVFAPSIYSKAGRFREWNNCCSYPFFK